MKLFHILIVYILHIKSLAHINSSLSSCSKLIIKHFIVTRYLRSGDKQYVIVLFIQYLAKQKAYSIVSSQILPPLPCRRCTSLISCSNLKITALIVCSKLNYNNCSISHNILICSRQIGNCPLRLYLSHAKSEYNLITLPHSILKRIKRCMSRCQDVFAMASDLFWYILLIQLLGRSRPHFAN